MKTKDERKQELLEALFDGKYYRLYGDDRYYQGTIHEQMYSECWEVTADIEFAEDGFIFIGVKCIEDKIMVTMLELQTYFIMMLRRYYCPTYDVTRDSVVSTQEGIDMEKHRFIFKP